MIGYLERVFTFSVLGKFLGKLFYVMARGKMALVPPLVKVRDTLVYIEEALYRLF